MSKIEENLDNLTLEELKIKLLEAKLKTKERELEIFMDANADRSKIMVSNSKVSINQVGRNNRDVTQLRADIRENLESVTGTKLPDNLHTYEDTVKWLVSGGMRRLRKK